MVIAPLREASQGMHVYDKLLLLNDHRAATEASPSVSMSQMDCAGDALWTILRSGFERDELWRHSNE
jgi:hypothetical protein